MLRQQLVVEGVYQLWQICSLLVETWWPMTMMLNVPNARWRHYSLTDVAELAKLLNAGWGACVMCFIGNCTILISLNPWTPFYMIPDAFMCCASASRCCHESGAVLPNSLMSWAIHIAAPNLPRPSHCSLLKTCVKLVQCHRFVLFNWCSN